MNDFSDELERLKNLYHSPSSDYKRKKTPIRINELIETNPILSMRFSNFYFSSKFFNQELDSEFGKTKK